MNSHDNTYKAELCCAGDLNTGNRNAGVGNSGDANLGDWNSGDANNVSLSTS